MASKLQSDEQIESPISPYQSLSDQLDNYYRYNKELWGKPITDRQFKVANLECKRAQKMDGSPKILCYNFGEPHETLANLVKVISSQAEYWYRDTVDPNEKYFRPFETTHRQGILSIDSNSIQLAERTIKYKPGFGILYGINMSGNQETIEDKTLNLVRDKQTNENNEYLVHVEGLFAYIQLINFYRSIKMGPPCIDLSLDGYEIRSRSAPGKIFSLCLCRLPGDRISKIHFKSVTSSMGNLAAPVISMR
jgi:hypothetical protein